MFPLLLLDLTLREVLVEIPHDSAAVLVYVLFAIFTGFIWYGSRSPDEPDEHERSA